MTLDFIGFVALATPKRGATLLECPLAYGQPGQPGPDQLLMGRGATLFCTEEEAWEAIRESLAACEAEGQQWMKKFSFTIGPATRLRVLIARGGADSIQRA